MRLLGEDRRDDGMVAQLHPARTAIVCGASVDGF
jgi:hypothetical protein